MRRLLTGWRAVAGAAAAMMLMGGSAGSAQAEEVDSPSGGGVVAMDHDDRAEADELSMGHRYAPPPPRGYRWYRPRWHVHVSPPPVFAPGWFGLYFLGSPPPPPPAAPPPPGDVGAPPPEPQKARRPDFRHVKEYSLGLNAGAYGGVYQDSPGKYTDPGLQFNLRYRNSPVVGAEFSVGTFGSNMRLDGYGTDARMDVPIQMSGVLHAFPRWPIQPYFLFGATGNIRTYEHLQDNARYTELRVGPHVGLGLELLIGDKVSISVDGRRIYYTLVDRSVSDQTYQRDRTITGGLNFYF